MNKEKLIKQLIRHEGLKLKPYIDTVNKTTIGVGRNLTDVGINVEEAMFLLNNDIAGCVLDLRKNLSFYDDLNDERKNVLINMCFNLGINRFLKFQKTLALIEKGDYEDASEEMLDSKWAIQVGYRATELADIMKKGES
jgi:lysozyme